MVSNADVTMAYRLLMGREPENQQAVQDLQPAAAAQDMNGERKPKTALPKKECGRHCH
jgi:hypothetical protein